MICSVLFTSFGDVGFLLTFHIVCTFDVVPRQGSDLEIPLSCGC